MMILGCGVFSEYGVSHPGSLNAQVLACGICEVVLICVCIMNRSAYYLFGGKVSRRVRIGEFLMISCN